MKCKATKSNETSCSTNALTGEEYCGNHLRIPKSIKNRLNYIEKNTPKIRKHRNLNWLEAIFLGMLSSLMATAFLEVWKGLKKVVIKIFQLFQEFYQFAFTIIIEFWEDFKKAFELTFQALKQLIRYVVPFLIIYLLTTSIGVVELFALLGIDITFTTALLFASSLILVFVVFSIAILATLLRPSSEVILAISTIFLALLITFWIAVPNIIDSIKNSQTFAELPLKSYFPTFISIVAPIIFITILSIIIFTKFFRWVILNLKKSK